MQRWRLVVIAAVICPAAAGLYLATIRPMYEATAQLLVVQQGGRPLNVSNAEPIRNLETPEDFLPTQMAILQSPRVVERAIESLGPKNLPTLLAAIPPRSRPTIRDLARLAIKNLAVNRPDRTALILLIAYRAGSPDEATRMVEALIKSYEDFLKEHFQGSNSRIVSLISKAHNELRRELGDLETRYLEFIQSHPVPIEDESGRSRPPSQLTELEREAGEAKVKALKLKSQIELGRKLAREGVETWAVAHAISQLGDPTNGQMIPKESENLRGLSSDYLRQVIKEQQELAAQYGPGYSKARELQEQITQIQERMQDSTGRMDRVGTSQLLASLEGSLEATEAMRGEIEKQLQSDRANLADMVTGRNLHDNLERDKMLFHAVVDQLRQAQLEGDYSSVDAQAVGRPNAVNKPVSPRWILTLGMSLLAGCALGMGTAVIADSLDTRIRSLEELRGVLGLNVLGQVPWLSVHQVRAMGEVSLISQALPRSSVAEAYRRVRTNIELCQRDRRTRVMVVTSPTAGDGKSVTASNLAISLAQAGRKVLLVDADLRTRSLSRVFGVPDHAGLVHLLRDSLPFGQAVQRTAVENLDFLAAGPEPPDPSELLLSARLRALLNEVRLSYEVVILDSPPLLWTTDPAVIGTAADGMLLVVRASIIRRQDAAIALEFLDVVKTPVLGVVVNGWASEREGYGYSHGLGAYGNDGSALAAGTASLPQTRGTPRLPSAGEEPTPGPREV